MSENTPDPDAPEEPPESKPDLPDTSWVETELIKEDRRPEVLPPHNPRKDDR